MGFFDDYDQADSLLEVEYESAPQKKQTTREVTDTSQVGWEWSEDVKKRMSASHLGKKIHTAESRKRIGDAHRGKVISQHQREITGSIWRGKTRSAETRAKMSAAKKGVVVPPEVRAKMQATRQANNACCKSVMTPNGVFPSIKAAEEAGVKSVQYKLKKYPDQYYYITKEAK